MREALVVFYPTAYVNMNTSAGVLDEEQERQREIGGGRGVTLIRTGPSVDEREKEAQQVRGGRGE